MSERPDEPDPTTAAESYGDYSVDDEDQPVAEDTLGDGDVSGAGSDVVDELDRGYSPPEHWSAAQGFGNTPYEEATGETLEQRVAQEVPEPDPYAEVDESEESEEDPAELVGEVGDQRAGRLVDPDEGFGTDTEKDLVGDDVGIDGAAASAEEAAMHVVDDPLPAVRPLTADADRGAHRCNTPSTGLGPLRRGALVRWTACYMPDADPPRHR